MATLGIKRFFKSKDLELNKQPLRDCKMYK